MNADGLHSSMLAKGFVWDGEKYTRHAPDKGERPLIQKLEDDHSSEREGIEAGDRVGQPGGDTGGFRSVQEKEADADNGPGVSAHHGGDDIQHRVTITIRFSNRRRTDLSGKLDTLLDCIVRARRRLLDNGAGTGGKGGTVRARKRRGDNNAGAVVKGPVPF